MRRSGTGRDPALFRLGAAEDWQERGTLDARRPRCRVPDRPPERPGSQLCRRLHRPFPHPRRGQSASCRAGCPGRAKRRSRLLPARDRRLTMQTRIRIQSEDFDLNAEVAKLTADGEAGAVASFTGHVRKEGDLSTLTLEHYPNMTEAEITRLVAEAGTRWPLIG